MKNLAQLLHIVGAFRMAFWFLLSVALYGLAMLLAQADLAPKIQIICWKIGHLNIAAFLGYWLDRNAFQDRIELDTAPLLQMRRAVIIAGAMLAVAMGL